MNKYVLYWLTGKAEVVQGVDIADAMNRAGYGNGALRALDFYDHGEDITYTWNTETKRWEQLEALTEELHSRTSSQRTCASCNCVLYPEERGYCDNCLDDNTSDNDVEQAVMSEWEAFDWERSNEEPPEIETVERTEPVKPPKHR